MEIVGLNARAIMSGFRKTLKLSAKEVSEKLDISRATLLKYEKDPRLMPVYMLDKFEELYGESFRDTFFNYKLYK